MNKTLITTVAAAIMACLATPALAGKCDTSDLRGTWHFSAMASVYAYQSTTEQIGTTIDRCTIRFDRDGQVTKFKCQIRDLSAGQFLPEDDDLWPEYSSGKAAEGCGVRIDLSYYDTDDDVVYRGLMTRDKGEIHGTLESYVPDDNPVKGIFSMVRK